MYVSNITKHSKCKDNIPALHYSNDALNVTWIKYIPNEQSD